MSNSQKLSRIKQISLNVLLILFSIIVVITLSEIALHFTKYTSTLNTKYGYPIHYFEKDAVLGYDIGKNIKDKKHIMRNTSYEVFSNKFGCFDYDRKVPDNYGLIVGDSQTWGYTRLDKKWTTKLEEESGNFMLKCGVTGFGTSQELIKAKAVISKVGKNPKYLTVLYIPNDLNDDFIYPFRTIVQGYLVSTVKNIDLKTGEKTYYTSDELDKEYQKYFDDSLENKFKKMRYNMITYMLYRNVAKPKIRDFKNRILNKDKNLIHEEVGNKEAKITMPDSSDEAYTVGLCNYFDTYDREWYNDLIDLHKNNIKSFKDYADKIGANLLFIDASGVLNHQRFSDVREYLGKSYYNLSSDYPDQSTWRSDGHWNIEGNQNVGEYIYKHYKKLGILK